jgi:2-keto-4-pentenoate hydratase/2-oxohepta-3-ene-1,7-dioic acid hydratase in catechol pathway
VREGHTPVSYFRVFDGSPEPEFLAKPTRHFTNLFETPTLFYAGCLAAMVAGVSGPVVVVLAWSFVAARLLHAWVHLGGNRVDWEVELVVVIGRRGKRIPRGEALSHVAGYMNGNDVSSRDWQIHKPGKQWLLGKTPDTFAPTGPWLTTADEVPDSKDLTIALRLNGETMQNSSTRELIFGVDELIAYVSQLVRLEPGDLIFTGTPPGVGMARKPPVWLKPGDVCEVEIAGLGVLRNPVVADE